MTAKKTTAKKTTKAATATATRTDVPTMADMTNTVGNAIRPLVERLEALEKKTGNMMNLAWLRDEVVRIVKIETGAQEKFLAEALTGIKALAEAHETERQAIAELASRLATIEGSKAEGVGADSMTASQHAATMLAVVDQVRGEAAVRSTDSRDRRRGLKRTNRHNPNA